MPRRSRAAATGDHEPLDVIVVGGGPAGLSAALMLGRCRRRVLVLDARQPRNGAARALHGFLSRDGIAPPELLRLGRGELRRYGVAWRAARVTSARSDPRGFAVTTAAGASFRARRLLLATGVRDRLPELPGLAELWGRAVHHCPYCDGWEHRDRPLAVYGRGKAGLALARKLRTWSAEVTLLTDGRSGYPAASRAALAAAGIALREERVERLEGGNGRLRRVHFVGGMIGGKAGGPGGGSSGAGPLACAALFLATGQEPTNALAASLGCELDHRGMVLTGRGERTCVPGVFAVGDVSRDAQFVMVAAAEGMRAAVAIHEELAGL